MKKNVITYGLLAGSVFVVFYVLLGLFHEKINFDNGMYYGFGSMILAFSFVFAGIKNYRDKYLNGSISFGNALKLGLLITVIASCFYVGAWMVVHKTMIPNFAEEYANHYVAKTKASGASADIVAAVTKEMEGFKETYKNPVNVVLYTFMEVLPLGILVSLIAALLLKRRPAPNS